MTREISCQEAARYVYRYLDGELEPRTRAEFLLHLDACRKCLGVVEFERRMLEFVRSRAASERPPAGLRDRVRRIFATGEGEPREGDGAGGWRGSPDGNGAGGERGSPDGAGAGGER